MAKNYFIILVQYTNRNQDKSIKIIKEYFKKQNVQFSKFLILDNAIQENFCKEVEPGISVVNGDNSSYEFSAWQKGLDLIKTDANDEDIILIANDTFHQNYSANFIEDINISKVKKLDSNFIYGFSDSYIQKVRFQKHESDTWIRTNFFLTSLKSLLSIDKLVSTTYEDIYSPSELINNKTNSFSSNYIELLSEWLIKDYELKIMTHKWYKASKLDEENREFLQRKSVSIINEHMLTAKIRNNGGKVIQSNFIRNRLSYIKRNILFVLKKTLK